ncbi:MAG TPA: response regulator [Candidatus Latescibacteria bacterium]|jgi:HD-like signal output (HDOD) protein/CheY-like chemotaxis protein|nr:response regulator [Candidatus Latescibacterota bacterium]HJP32164.1 response regulator [Candidatus Latescibacterota bacterium]
MSAQILVVEKNEKIGGLICAQLREKGHGARDCRNGPEAVLALRQEGANVILLNNAVPMGGVKTARILRMHEKYNHIPIIIGLPPEKEEARVVIKEGQEAGIAHFLLKPFTLTALQKKLTEVLESGDTVEQPTHQEIRDEIKNLSNLPAMPAAHSKLLTLLSKADEEVDMRQVSATLEQDPALTAKVMRTCRSAYFGFQGNMMSQAVAFLGAAVIHGAFGDSTESSATAALSMNDLWKHSLATGMAMEVIGKADKKKTHFLLGTLHDIGKAVFLFRFPDHFGKVLDLVEAENISVLNAEYELLGITHADCGGELAIHWDLPGEVRTAITSHHQPGKSTQHRRLAAMVHIADIAVRTMEIGYGGDPLIPEMDPYASRLQKSVEEIIKNKDDFIQQCDSILGA